MSSPLPSPRAPQPRAASPNMNSTARSGFSTGSANYPTIVCMSHIKRGPKWTFGGRHERRGAEEGPGPGAYDLQPPDSTSRFPSSPRARFGQSARSNGLSSRAPGPGAYTEVLPNKIGASKGVPAYSLVARRSDPREKLDKDTPGPGQHTLPSSIGQGVKHTVSPRYQENKKAVVPGPGDYEPKHVAGKRLPTWVLGTSQRPDAANTAGGGPGPGAYGSFSVVGEGPKYSMKARFAERRQQASPGPGAHGGHYSCFS